MLQKYLEEYNRKKGDKRLKLEEPETYSLKEILQRAKTSTSKEGKDDEVSASRINELMHEVKVLKRELNTLKSRVTLLELKRDASSSSSSSESEEIDESLENKELNSNSLTYVNMLDRVITHKWHIKIKIIVHREYTLSAIAMVDSGADLNCINEGLIPSRYFSKTTEVLNAADGRKMIVNYKLQNTAICNNGICLEMPFIMVKNLSHDVILGNPFLHMLYPIKSIDEKGITSSINSQEITFNFVTEPRYHEIDLLQKKIHRKENFLNSWHQDHRRRRRRMERECDEREQE